MDAKTVERWITRDVTPHRATALNAARCLNKQVAYLWPALDNGHPQTAGAEVVAFYPHRSVTPKSLWFDLVQAAQREITLMAYASLFLPEDNPQSIQLLKGKAAAGVRIRIALGDPDTPEIALRGVEEQLYEGLVDRVRMAITYHRPLVGVPGIELHLHRTTLYNSIFVYDDEMQPARVRRIRVHGPHPAPLPATRRRPLLDVRAVTGAGVGCLVPVHTGWAYGQVRRPAAAAPPGRRA